MTGFEPFAALGPLAKLVPEGIKAAFRRRKFADEELIELRKQVIALMATITEGAVEAQIAVRGSPNDDQAHKAQSQAIRCGTVAGQEFACLVRMNTVSDQVPPRLIDHRLRYRELVTDEANLDLIDPGERKARCAEIEDAAADFHCSLRDYAFKHWGIGVGAKAGRLKGRGRPR